MTKNNPFSPSETEIKLQVKKYLEIRRIFSWHIAQSIASYKGAPDRVLHLPARNVIRTPARPGKGQELIWMPAQVVYLEIKKPGGKLSEAQLEFQAQCIRDGIGENYWVVHSVTELDVLLR